MLVIVGGVVIFEVVFVVLGIECMCVCESLMCEGFLWDLFGCVGGSDLCIVSIDVLVVCYGVDCV